MSLGSWPGGAWVPWRALLWSSGVVVASGDPGSHRCSTMLVLLVSTSVFRRACEKGIVMLPRGVSEGVADNLFGCRAFGRHLEGM